MKKILSMLCLLLLQKGYAQTTSGAVPHRDPVRAQFGLKAGLNLADLKTDFYSNQSKKSGFHIGGLAHIHLNRHLAVQPEIVYSQQGTDVHLSSNLDAEMELSYINIPVMIQYMNRGVRIETGPQVGFLAGSEFDYSDGQEQDIKDKLKKVDFSWGFGVGYLSPVNFGLGIRYNLGISNINESITAPNVTDTEMNNRVWQFSIFYQFPR
ncbi:MAG TPA: porin family protein [Chitinophagaceae bacterium]|nr:porin family protein [Chitinophagaceae bacterium]